MLLTTLPPVALPPVALDFDSELDSDVDLEVALAVDSEAGRLSAATQPLHPPHTDRIAKTTPTKSSRHTMSVTNPPTKLGHPTASYSYSPPSHPTATTTITNPNITPISNVIAPQAAADAGVATLRTRPGLPTQRLPRHPPLPRLAPFVTVFLTVTRRPFLLFTTFFTVRLFFHRPMRLKSMVLIAAHPNPPVYTYIHNAPANRCTPFQGGSTSATRTRTT